MRTFPDANLGNPASEVFFEADLDGVYSFTFKVRSVNGQEYAPGLTVSVENDSHQLASIGPDSRGHASVYLSRGQKLLYSGNGFTVACNRQGDEFPPEQE